MLVLFPFFKKRVIAEMESRKQLQEKSNNLSYNAQILIERSIKLDEKEKIEKIKEELAGLHDV